MDDRRRKLNTCSLGARCVMDDIQIDWSTMRTHRGREVFLYPLARSLVVSLLSKDVHDESRSIDEINAMA